MADANLQRFLVVLYSQIASALLLETVKNTQISCLALFVN